MEEFKPSKETAWFWYGLEVNHSTTARQGLVLGPTLFNIHLGGFFLILNDIAI